MNNLKIINKMGNNLNKDKVFNNKNKIKKTQGIKIIFLTKIIIDIDKYQMVIYKRENKRNKESKNFMNKNLISFKNMKIKYNKITL